MKSIIDDIKNNGRKYLLRTQDEPKLYFEIPFTDELGKKFDLKLAAIQFDNRSNKIYIMSNKINKYQLSTMSQFVGVIGCVHVSITRPYIEESKQKEFIESTENIPKEKEKYITKIEQFASIISYITGIANLGIQKIIGIGYIDNPELRPLGFDDIFLKQFVSAVAKALQYSNYDKEFHKLQGNWIAEILKPLTENEEWFKERWDLFKEKYHLRIFKDIPYIEELFSKLEKDENNGND